MQKIDCSVLFRAMGGHERYAAAQRVLHREGWRYMIALDGWICPGWVAQLRKRP